MAGKTVAVTGANGFIATWVVKLLLERGYTVRGTVRNPDDSAKVAHLWELPGAKERLTLHKASLLEDGAFDDIFAGVDGVFHAASPVLIKFEDPEKDLLLPALKGTINALSSAAKAGTVKRVVFTSSNAAVSFSEAAAYPTQPNVVVDESWWSDDEWCVKNEQWYMLSKLRAEKAAWDFVKDHQNFDLVTINPALVVGPILHNTLNASSEMLLVYLDGSMKELPGRARPVAVVHVKDVAMAHILAYEDPSAQGRYFVPGEPTMLVSQLADLLRKICPDSPIPKKPVESGEKVFCPIFSAEKVKKLGLVFTPIEDTLRECIASLKENNWLK
ncbi:hypothetical protein R1flu_026352 [Riccia fluitans]|uniref:NAD-dependent epimerase/dehydratase domain-containing protein n=1 Tax=Riccia fluitans TaxID=41844 RepID=A0ABD1XFP3_9MARC